jgi:hypothetical protein
MVNARADAQAILMRKQPRCKPVLKIAAKGCRDLGKPGSAPATIKRLRLKPGAGT